MDLFFNEFSIRNKDRIEFNSILVMAEVYKELNKI